MKAAGIALLVIGVAVIALAVTIAVRSTPASLHCTRSAGTCRWERPRWLGGSDEITLPLASLHDSRTEYESHRTGVSTRWVVTGPGGNLQLGDYVDRTDQAVGYERLARDFQRFLTHTQPASFDAEFAARNLRGWLVLAIFAGLAVVGSIFLLRA